MKLQHRGFTAACSASPLQRIVEALKRASVRRLQLLDTQRPSVILPQLIYQPQQQQQVLQQQQPADDDDDDDDDAVNANNDLAQSPYEDFVSDTEEMAEDKSLIPPSFTGRPGEDGDIWLRHFRNYCTYKEYGDAKSLALLKVLLTGNAALWLDTLPHVTLGA